MIVTPDYIKNSKMNCYDPDSIVRVPTQWDDEFNGLSLDPKWSMVVDTMNTKDYGKIVPGAIYTLATADQAYQMRQSFVPGDVDFSVTLRSRVYKTANYTQSSITALDAGLTNGVRAGICYSSALGAGFDKMQLSVLNSGTWSWGLQETTSASHPYFFIHLQRNGNVWFAAVSIDGVSWLKSSTTTKTLTVGNMDVTTEQAGSTLKTVHTLEWVRVNWITL